MADVLRVMRRAELDAATEAEILGRGRACFDPELRESISRLVESVRDEGDEAVARATRDFDGCSVRPDGLRVGEAEFAAARDQVGEDLVAAISASIDRVRSFNERLLPDPRWSAEIGDGVQVGQRSTPIASAGLFVPSGKGSYPSTLLQIGTPAVVAKVPEIAIAVPPVPGSDGRVDPAVLVTAELLGIGSVFRANGPAGVAALAFGTESVPRVVKVLGPGSPPVQAAQLEVQRYGTASVILLGATESMVVADGSADVPLLAADLLTEAEHGSDSAVVLVTPEPDLVARLGPELRAQLESLPEPRRAYAGSALGRNGGALIVGSFDEAVEFANLYAPEHLQLVVSDPDPVIARFDHAAEVLVGQATPFSLANYTIGVPAALPTARFGRVSSGVTAETFLKRVSIARLSPAAAAELAPAAALLADWEGFPAHAAAARRRA